MSLITKISVYVFVFTLGFFAWILPLYFAFYG
jgi:hypothetical protein